MRLLRERALALGSAAVVALALGACSSHPGLSNGSVSDCFRAEPVARSALRTTHATLMGVHRVRVDRIRSRLPAQLRARLAAGDDTLVCALTFKGPFDPGQVELAPPFEHGAFAVVMVDSRNLHLVGAVVLDRVPQGLGRRVF